MPDFGHWIRRRQAKGLQSIAEGSHDEKMQYTHDKIAKLSFIFIYRLCKKFMIKEKYVEICLKYSICLQFAKKALQMCRSEMSIIRTFQSVPELVWAWASTPSDLATLNPNEVFATASNLKL